MMRTTVFQSYSLINILIERQCDLHGENHLHHGSIFIVKENVVPGYDDGTIMKFNDGFSLEGAFEIFWNAKSAEVTYQTFGESKL